MMVAIIMVNISIRSTQNDAKKSTGRKAKKLTRTFGSRVAGYLPQASDSKPPKTADSESIRLRTLRRIVRIGIVVPCRKGVYDSVVDISMERTGLGPQYLEPTTSYFYRVALHAI